jgi:hypothetical protein
MTRDAAEQAAAALDGAREDLERLCREAVGNLRARGVPPVPVVALRPGLLRRIRTALLVDVAWPLVTLHERRPALFSNGALRPVSRHRAPEPDGPATLASPGEQAVRWDHTRLGTRPGSLYLRDAGAPLELAVVVPSRFIGMPMPGPAGGDLGVAVPTGRLVYPSVDRTLGDGDEVSWWPLAEELTSAVARLAEEYRADPWPDPRGR